MADANMMGIPVPADMMAGIPSASIGEYGDLIREITYRRVCELLEWRNPADMMPPFKPKTPVSVTVEILTSDNKVVKAIYDARVSVWLSAEEWYKPEQVLGWRCVADG